MAGNDSYTKSLLHMNGTDASTTFTDDAVGGTHTWAAYGQAKLSTTSQKLGSACGTFDGFSDYVQASDVSDDFNFGAGDFTIDFWIKRGGEIGRDQRFGLFSSSAAGVGYFMMQIYSDNKIYATLWDTLSASHQITGTTVISDTTTWHHVALVRYGNTLTIYIDGTACGTHDLTGKTLYDNTLWKATWGRLGDNGTDTFNGRLDEVRVSKGIARWTADFTPPTAEYSTSASDTGSVCWGHITGVTEDNVRTFIYNWTGTGRVEDSGDSERLALGAGDYLESETVETGAVEMELLQNNYQAGDTVVLKYRHGATKVDCLAAGWNTYSTTFVSLGYVQVRVEVIA